MRNTLIIFLLFISFINLYSLCQRAAEPYLITETCSNGKISWRLVEDRNRDGNYDWITISDCELNQTTGPIGGPLVPFNLSNPNNWARPNEKVHMTDNSIDCYTNIEIKSFDSVNNINYYITNITNDTICTFFYFAQTQNIKLNNTNDISTNEIRQQYANGLINDKTVDGLMKNKSFQNIEIEKTKVKEEVSLIDSLNYFVIPIANLNQYQHCLLFQVYDKKTGDKNEIIEYLPDENITIKSTYLRKYYVGSELLNSYSITIFNIYPNPAKDNIHFTIDSKQNAIADIKIIDLKGNMVGISKKVQLIQGENSVTYDLENTLSNGNYFLHTSINGNVLNTPFVISK